MSPCVADGWLLSVSLHGKRERGREKERRAGERRGEEREEKRWGEKEREREKERQKERERKREGPSPLVCVLMRALIPSGQGLMFVTSSNSHYLIKIHMGVRFSTYDFGGE